MAIPIGDLSIGSVVRLISGSPKMAVVGLSDGNLVEVIWWSDALGVLTDKFPPEILTFPRVAPATDGSPE